MIKFVHSNTEFPINTPKYQSRAKFIFDFDLKPIRCIAIAIYNFTKLNISQMDSSTQLHVCLLDLYEWGVYLVDWMS